MAKNKAYAGWERLTGCVKDCSLSKHSGPFVAASSKEKAHLMECTGFPGLLS